MNNSFRILLSLGLCLFTSLAQAQIRVTSDPPGTQHLLNTSAVIDLSTLATTTLSSSNRAKGIVFPYTDLTLLNNIAWNFLAGASNNFPTFFDGMLVYNVASGNSGLGNVPVKRGFYFYKNDQNVDVNNLIPDFTNTKANEGVWVRLADDGDVFYTADGALSGNRTIDQGSNSLNFINGNIGVGTSNTQARLVVAGASINDGHSQQDATTIDFSQRNLIRSNVSNANTFTLSNIQSGGTYTLAVTGGNGTPAFVVPAGFTLFTPNLRETAGERTLYTLIVMGTEVYIYQTTNVNAVQ